MDSGRECCSPYLLRGGKSILVLSGFSADVPDSLVKEWFWMAHVLINAKYI